MVPELAELEGLREKISETDPAALNAYTQANIAHISRFVDVPGVVRGAVAMMGSGCHKLSAGAPSPAAAPEVLPTTEGVECNGLSGCILS